MKDSRELSLNEVWCPDNTCAFLVQGNAVFFIR
jgi:hypothetical protein